MYVGCGTASLSILSTLLVEPALSLPSSLTEHAVQYINFNEQGTLNSVGWVAAIIGVARTKNWGWPLAKMDE